MANAIFFQNSRAISNLFSNPPNYSDLMRAENHVVLQNILNNLSAEILANWDVKVTYASERGFQFTTIYRYFRTDMYDGYPIYLLINGPDLEYNFFIDNGYTSVLEQIRSTVDPGKVSNNFSFQNFGSEIVLSWNIN